MVGKKLNKKVENLEYSIRYSGFGEFICELLRWESKIELIVKPVYGDCFIRGISLVLNCSKRRAEALKPIARHIDFEG